MEIKLKKRFQEQDIGYLAGIIDGEGSIMICKRVRPINERGKIQYFPLVSISNTNLSLLNWISNFLKKLQINHAIIQNTISSDKHSQSYRLNISGLENTKNFLGLLLPYLKIKQEHAANTLEFIYSRINSLKNDNRGRHNCKYSQNEMYLFDKLKLLNLRGK